MASSGESHLSHVAQLEEENQRLRKAVDELSILNELARVISSTMDLDAVIENIVKRSMRAVQADQGVITLVDQHSSESMKTLVRAMVESHEQQSFHLNQSLLGWMHLNKKPILINDPKNDDRFRGVKWEESVHTLLSVPMMTKGALVGLLTIYNKKDARSFTDDDQRLLAIIAAQSAQVVENARLYEEEKALHQMKEEIRLASRIQAELLPKHSPAIKGYDIAGNSLPAKVVGGDYYDFIPVDDQRWAVCLGDVSGKGLPASLLMANLQATLRGQTLLDVTPRECLRRSNTLLFHSTTSDKFATLFYGILDVSRHTLCFSNAGHDNPFLLTQGKEPHRLKTGGTVLSIFEHFPYEEEVISLRPNDVLLIYSDGVTEAMNATLDQFGEERLKNLLIENRNVSANDLVEKIIAAVKQHAGSFPQSDDITLVVLKRTVEWEP